MTNKTNKQLILTWMRRLYRTSKKANLIMTPHLHQVAIGCMLGDIHAENLVIIITLDCNLSSQLFTQSI